MFNDIYMKDQFRGMARDVKIILEYMKELKEEAQNLKQEVKELKEAVKKIKK